MLSAVLPFPPSEAMTGWETGFQEAQAESQPSQASPSLPSPCLLKAAPWSDSSVGLAGPGPLWGWWEGRELLWGLLQSIVRLSAALSLSVCHSEMNRYGERSGWLVARKKGLSLSVRGGEEGGQGGGSGGERQKQLLNPPPAP